MAATGKTPILLYGSTTATNAPSAGNLTNSSDGCEIAINVADKNLFFKDSTNAINTVPIRQSNASSNGWLSSTDWSTFNNKAATSSPTFSGDVTLSTGNLAIGTSGKGIDFSVTSSGTGTATSELFSDYEEGTFTPAVYGTTSAGTATYASQYGRYTKIGDTVRFTIYLNWGSHTGTGNMRISGLPYTPNSNANEFSIPATWCGNLALTAGNIVVCQVAPGDTNLYVVQNPTGGGASSAVAMDVGASMVITGTYRVN